MDEPLKICTDFTPAEWQDFVRMLNEQDKNDIRFYMALSEHDKMIFQEKYRVLLNAPLDSFGVKSAFELALSICKLMMRLKIKQMPRDEQAELRRLAGLT